MKFPMLVLIQEVSEEYCPFSELHVQCEFNQLTFRVLLKLQFNQWGWFEGGFLGIAIIFCIDRAWGLGCFPAGYLCQGLQFLPRYVVWWEIGGFLIWLPKKIDFVSCKINMIVLPVHTDICHFCPPNVFETAGQFKKWKCKKVEILKIGNSHSFMKARRGRYC